MTTFARRTVFNSSFLQESTVNWFPGHMAKAIKSMENVLSKVDIVIEVRDCRIPLTSYNNRLEQIIGNKARVVVYNKKDLADQNTPKLVSENMRVLNGDVTPIFSKAKGNPEYFAPLKKLAADTSKGKVRIYDPEPEVYMMVVGIPNVGKSTIINSLSNLSGHKNVVNTGKLPGVTRGITYLRIFENPKTFLLDTPGVMIPSVKDLEVGFKLALTGAVRDEVVGALPLADFLLYSFNKIGYTGYADMFNTKPTDDLLELLNSVCDRIGAKVAGGLPHYEIGARYFVKVYRQGGFGRFTLDEINKESVNQFYSSLS